MIIDTGVITRTAGLFNLVAAENVKHREHLSAKFTLQYDNLNSVYIYGFKKVLEILF
jgi:hypothetical protein